jgi:hypothetical protein
VPSDAATVLGRLLADPAARAMLRRDPLLAAGALDADPALLESLDLDGLEEQARGLVEKRFHEVAKLLPWTVAGLGPEAPAVFARHAAAFWPEGHRRHALDAESFARFLESRSLPLCRSEVNRLRFGMGGSRFGIRWVSDALVEGRSRRALQILYRRRGAVRSLALYLGF